MARTHAVAEADSVEYRSSSVATPESVAADRWRRWAACAVLTVVFATILLLRRPEGLSDPTIWAEDGRVFLAGSFDGVGSLVRLYAGEMWPVQRVGAAAVALFPASVWPQLLYVLSCVVAALGISVVLQRRMEPIFGRFRFRVGIGLLLVLAPTAWEVQGNLANLHWWLAGALLMVLVSAAPRALGWRVVELSVIALVALTGVLGFLLLPVAIWRALTSRQRYDYLRGGVVAVAAAVNVLVTAVLAGRVGEGEPIAALGQVPGYLLKRIGGGITLGDRLMERLWGAGLLSPLLLLAAVVAALLLALAVLDRRGPSWTWAAVGVVCATLGAVGTVRTDWPYLLEPYLQGRYVFLAVFAAILVLGRALGTGAARARILAIVGIALMLPAIVFDARLKPLAPAVPRQDLVAFQQCLDGAPPYTEAPFCFVTIQPTTDDWRIVVLRPPAPA